MSPWVPWLHGHTIRPRPAPRQRRICVRCGEAREISEFYGEGQLCRTCRRELGDSLLAGVQR